MRSPRRSLLFSRLNSPSAGTSSRPWLGKLQNVPTHVSRRERPRAFSLSLPPLGGRGAWCPRQPRSLPLDCPLFVSSRVCPSVPLSAPSGAAVTPRAPIGRFKSRGLLERRGRLQARPSPAPPLRPRRRPAVLSAVLPSPAAAMLAEQENQENVPPPAAGKAAAPLSAAGTRVALGLLRGAQQRAGISLQVRRERRGDGKGAAPVRRGGSCQGPGADGRSPHRRCGAAARAMERRRGCSSSSINISLSPSMWTSPMGSGSRGGSGTSRRGRRRRRRWGCVRPCVPWGSGGPWPPWATSWT